LEKSGLWDKKAGNATSGSPSFCPGPAARFLDFQTALLTFPPEKHSFAHANRLQRGLAFCQATNRNTPEQQPIAHKINLA
jgi:hypothetical protein